MSPWVLALALACRTEAPPTPIAPDPPEVPAELPPEAPEPPPAPPSEPRYAATHVLIAWAGAASAPASVVRTEEEARALAEELRARALAGEDLASIARERSDGPSAARGGALGVYETGTMIPDFEAAVASVAPGEIGPLAQTPYGWHVVRRDAVVQGRFSHIQVSWSGAWRSGATRSKAEARARAEEALARLSAGEAFDAVARALSDDPSAAAGGDLGLVAPGQMVPVFDETAFALGVGETSGIVETPYGFHVIRRGE